MGKYRQGDLFSHLDALNLGEFADELLRTGLVQWDDSYKLMMLNGYVTAVYVGKVRGGGVSPPIASVAGLFCPASSKRTCAVDASCYECGYCRLTGEVVEQGDRLDISLHK